MTNSNQPTPPDGGDQPPRKNPDGRKPERSANNMFWMFLLGGTVHVDVGGQIQVGAGQNVFLGISLGVVRHHLPGLIGGYPDPTRVVRRVVDRRCFDLSVCHG